MNKEAIVSKMNTIFRSVFNDESIAISDETTAKDIGSWDSLTHMIMITEVENTFAIKFKLREINKLKNVGVLVELIESKLAV